MQVPGTDTFALMEEITPVTYIAIGAGTRAHALSAVAGLHRVPVCEPRSTKLPSEAVRETSQVNQSNAEVRVEVK